MLQALIALIAIANPLAAVPVFLSLVPANDPVAQRHAARTAWRSPCSPSWPARC